MSGLLLSSFSEPMTQDSLLSRPLEVKAMLEASPSFAAEKRDRGDYNRRTEARRRLQECQLKEGTRHIFSFVGHQKPCCVTPLEELEKVYLNNMKVNGSCKGLFLLGRVVSVPELDAGITMLVEDEQATVEQITIFNWPLQAVEVPSSGSWQVAALFPPGSIVVIKEPNYTLDLLDAQQTIEVHSPTDVVLLSSDHALVLSATWASPAPDAAQEPGPCMDRKEAGDAAFGRKQYSLAVHHYTQALQGLSSPIAQVTVRLNRAAAHLKLANYRSAHRDTLKALELLKTRSTACLQEKALLRRAKAEEGLGLLKEANATYLLLAQQRPGSFDARDGLERVTQREREASEGAYDFAQLIRSTASGEPPPPQDVASFVGPIEIREAEGRGGGRGVFATRDIDVGELLLCEKAFATAYPRQGEEHVMRHCFNFQYKTYESGERADLVAAVVARLLDDGSKAKAIYSIYAGPDSSPSGPIADFETLMITNLNSEETATIDIARIEGMCTYTAFGLSSFGHEQHHGMGLFPRASFFNHSCLPSAKWYCAGDVMVVRARRRIAKGEEVMISYGSHFTEQRSPVLKILGQTACGCELCELNRLDGQERLARRALLLQRGPMVTATVDKYLNAKMFSQAIIEARQHLADLDSTYSPSHGPLRPDLIDILGLLTPALFLASPTPASTEEVLELEKRCLEAYGVVAAFPSDSSEEGFNIQATSWETTAAESKIALSNAWKLKHVGDVQQARRWTRLAFELCELSMGPGAFDAVLGEFVEAVGLKDMIQL